LVRRDSVEVVFEMRIQANATAFDAWVSVMGGDLQQGVRPEEDDAATVFVPSVASGVALIRQVEVSSLLTPNGDRVNDQASIGFVLAKVEAGSPQVSFFDLSGRQVRVLAAGADGYRWDGRDGTGQMLPPGAYVCQIKLAADIGDETVHRIVNLAY
jgi:hypothetical protein